MMCAKLLRHDQGGTGNPMTRWLNGLVEGSVAFYGRSLEWVLRHQRLTLLVTFVTLVATVGLYIVMPKGFLPLQDTGLISAVTEAGTEVSFAEMQRLQKLVSDRIRQDPDVTAVILVVGVTTINAKSNAAQLSFTLRPL